MARAPANKASATAKAAPKKTGTALVNWEDELAKYATEAQAVEASVSTGNFISTKGGRLSYNGGEVPGNKMNVIILDHVLENHFYEGRFDPDTPQSPICFAFGRVEDELAPHEKSDQPQNDTCAGCPNNEWGTADQGKGKACKNIRRLALIPEDGLDDISAATVAYLKVPVTSVKAWAGYVNQLAGSLRRPPFGVITEISIVPDPKTQFKVQFAHVDTIQDAEVFEAIIAKRSAITEEIMAPYSPPTEAPPAPAPRGRGKATAAAKPAARGKAKY